MKKLSIAVILLVVFLILPIFVWIVNDRLDLEIVIIDKTVPDETYREHIGLTWLVNHFKLTKAPISYQKDYVGFVPDETNEAYEIRELPVSYEDVDVIYVADSYGVYEDDAPWLKTKGKRDGTRSAKLYGGLSMEEWQAIYERLTSAKRSTFIAEFNSFASPTPHEVKQSITSYLNITWSGWIGRYFHELNPELNLEIPQWIFHYYDENKWEYSGPGFILVNEKSDEIVVLEEGAHVGKHGIRLQFTTRGQEKFGLQTSPQYRYWFDIVEATDQSSVLANYDWDVTEAGKKLLEKHQIPVQFAGIIERERGQAKSYYFAGDFADIEQVPALYQYYGLSAILAWLYKSDRSEKSFFWNTYVPVMKTILSDSREELAKSSAEKMFANTADGSISYNARINGQQFEMYIDGKWEPILIKGVNIGMGKPGVFPGEAAIQQEEYYRWFQQIGAMGANAIRVYTLHPPGFYDALKQYNEENDDKLYLFHGVWIEEESMEATLDAFYPYHTDKFQREMKTIVDVIHGNALVEHEPGHASGLYRSDISEYVIGWILGIEWYPYMVRETNEKYKGLLDYDGRFVYTDGADPFEVWLAEQMDFIISYEMDNYKWIRPLSFTNWVTTDLLEHPAEPSEQEDLATVNPNLIHLKHEMLEVNQFASYHVYPYYPDFLNYEEAYVNYIDHRGERNNYAAYLRDLHEAHELPILIAEFGVPASRGLTHENPFGWNQGFLSEQEQGEIVVRLFEDIVHEGLLGGLIFTWQDEWFKRTWNTMDYDNPDRRPFWSNAQTNEQQFGILSFDRHKIRVDGKREDWGDKLPIYSGANELQKLYIDHDERYLYFRLELADAARLGTGEFPIILLDTVPGQGNEHISFIEELTLERGMDFLIYLKDEQEAAVLVDDYYDFFTYQYVHQLKLLEMDRALPARNSGFFTPIYYALSRDLFIPSQEKFIPFAKYEAGKLMHGNGNHEEKDYNSLADFYINRKEGVIEIRIPWLLLSFRDPSMKEVMADLYREGEELGAWIDGIYVAVLYVTPSYEENGAYQVMDALPTLSAHKRLKANEIALYEWEKWQQPLFEERLKRSYYIIQEAFRK